MISFGHFLKAKMDSCHEPAAHFDIGLTESLVVVTARPIFSSVSTRIWTIVANVRASSERFSALSGEEGPEIVSFSLKAHSSGCVLNHSSRMEMPS